MQASSGHAQSQRRPVLTPVSPVTSTPGPPCRMATGGSAVSSCCAAGSVTEAPVTRRVSRVAAGPVQWGASVPQCRQLWEDPAPGCVVSVPRGHTCRPMCRSCRRQAGKQPSGLVCPADSSGAGPAGQNPGALSARGDASPRLTGQPCARSRVSREHVLSVWNHVRVRGRFGG